jgi:hypothetical protein
MTLRKNKNLQNYACYKMTLKISLDTQFNTIFGFKKNGKECLCEGRRGMGLYPSTPPGLSMNEAKNN